MAELETSDLEAKAAQLAVLADIFTKSRAVYQIERVAVKHFKQRQISTDSNDRLFIVTAAACNVNLKTLDIGSNDLGVKHFAAIGSALRYGFQIETLDVEYVLKKLFGARGIVQ